MLNSCHSKCIARHQQAQTNLAIIGALLTSLRLWAIFISFEDSNIIFVKGSQSNVKLRVKKITTLIKFKSGLQNVL